MKDRMLDMVLMGIVCLVLGFYGGHWIRKCPQVYEIEMLGLPAAYRMGVHDCHGLYVNRMNKHGPKIVERSREILYEVQCLAAKGYENIRSMGTIKPQR